MRKMKFRAWHKSANEMLYEERAGDCFRWLNEGQPVEIMQFTGLHDKKGKEIWEGDILEVRRVGVGRVVYGNYSIGRDDWGVEHITPGFSLEWPGEPDGGHTGIDNKNRFEIIGNIYENPELLKK